MTAKAVASTRQARSAKRHILIGTASWSDPGFVADWYPAGMPASERLPWYAEHFNLVEVNSSFYGIPKQKTVAEWAARTPRRFVFDVKLFSLLSRHSTPVERLPPELRPVTGIKSGKVDLTPRLERRVAREFLEAVAPLREAGKLGALLLQLSPSFGPRKHRLAELDDLIGLLRGYRLAVELRNRGWVKGDALAETEAFFRSRKLAFVTVDAPPSEHFMAMPPLDLVTRPDLAYLRAHGRNTHGYLHGKTVAARFDYDYSEDELRQITDRTIELVDLASEVHVIFNNNKSDYALRSATKMREIVAEMLPDMPQKR